VQREERERSSRQRHATTTLAQGERTEKALEKSSRGRLRRQWFLWKHAAVHWLNAEKWYLRLLYGGSWIYLLIVPMVKAGLAWGTVISFMSIIGIRGRKAILELDPKHVKRFRKTYDQRKLVLEQLLHDQQQWRQHPPSESELHRFRIECLKLIALYVRDHRYDIKGEKVFVNLLVRRTEDTVDVISRADPGRPTPKRYRSDECALVWKVITTGAAQVTGHVYEDFPGTGPGKAYLSIIALPIRLGNRVLGAVSIDSGEKFHFDRYFEDLQTGLAPYVQLIALAVPQDHDTHQLTGGER
jgi:hypothetical protein